jgi:hypothetical protein
VFRVSALTGQAAAVRVASEAHSNSGFGSRNRHELEAYGQKNRYELFHLYFKCFVSFYGMVNFFGEEKNGRYKNNMLDFYWLKQRAHTGRYVLCISIPALSVCAGK